MPPFLLPPLLQARAVQLFQSVSSLHELALPGKLFLQQVDRMLKTKTQRHLLGIGSNVIVSYYLTFISL